MADIVRVRLQRTQLDSRYVTYGINSACSIKQLEELTKGTTRPRVNLGHIRKLWIPLAPANEQKRIADKLDQTLAIVERAKARLARVPEILKQFRQSVLAAATDGRLTEDWRLDHHTQDVSALIAQSTRISKSRRGVEEVVAKGGLSEPNWSYPSQWARETTALLISKEIFVDVKDGNHGANHPRVDEFTETGLPFITATQVKDFIVDYDGAYKVTGAPLAKLRVGFAKPDDVVLTHKGTVGRVAVVDRECVLTPQTTYYRVNPDFVCPKYLMYYLASPPFANQLADIKSQTTRDFVPISQQYSLWHLIPGKNEQHEIVRQVEILFALADRIEARYQAICEKVDKLTQSLLAKAFRGELVPQDPNDEPASELLARIAATRASSSTSRTNRNPRMRKSVRAQKENATMTKSRQDEEIKDKPYLADHLRLLGGSAAIETLFKASELPVADFYKQLAWEVERGYVRDAGAVLEDCDAA